jgi:hypothetical protein
MSRIVAIVFMALALLAPRQGLPSPLDGRPVAPAGEWRFDVTLDGRPIGRHTFRVKAHGDGIRVDSHASFDVRILGFSLYRYEHRATEHWKNGCLAALDSNTDDNGTSETVSGTLAREGFVVTRRAGTTTLPSCTMTFAYWNPAMRSQGRLLNPQTGVEHEVNVDARGAGRIDGTEASRYVLRGKDLEIEVAYAKGNDRWIALDSRTSRGGILSYRLAAQGAP